MFQYSFCSYSTNRKHDSIKRWKVSIQLLFLFNQLPKIIDVFLEVFQYSFCSYSTWYFLACNPTQYSFNTASVLIQRIEMQRGEIYIVFQYSFCSYSTDADVIATKQMLMFQYSFCSYSTVCYSDAWKISGGFNTASVLIQHIHPLIGQKTYMSFNTASVLIQPWDAWRYYV